MSTFQIRDLELAYDDEGKGPAVVLLHGYPFNRSMWREQAAALRTSHRVIVPDLRNHGESSVVKASIPEMARDVAALMTALDVSEATICGLSMGGYVTLSFYRQFPERVKGLVLADTRASADTGEGKQARAKQAERALQEGMEGIANDMLPKLLRVNAKPEVIERVRQMILKTKPQGAAEALQAMATREDQSSFLPEINTPTLILVGREDAITPVKDSEVMQRAINGSRFEIIEEAGHVSNLDQPDRFNECLLGFLQSI